MVAKPIEQGRKQEAAASAPATSALAGLSPADIARLVAKGREAEEKEKAKGLGKKEKAKLARATKAMALRFAKDHGFKPTLAEVQAWIAAHPPTPPKPKKA